MDARRAELYQLVARMRGTTGSKLIVNFGEDYLVAHPEEVRMAERAIAARQLTAPAPAVSDLAAPKLDGVLSAAPAAAKTSKHIATDRTGWERNPGRSGGKL